MTDKALLLHWLAACSGPLLAAGAAQAQQAASAQRPNILFILTDDQRWDAVGYVNPIVRTPHIDSLAREGVCFRNAFVTTPISAASRASLLTGMYERTHGYTFRQGPLKEPYMQQSYPVLLRASGYTTAYFGKFGVIYPGAQRLFDAADLYDRRGKFPDRRGYFYKTIDGDTVHLTRYTGYEAQRFLREVDPSKPFCLSLGFSAPHAHDPAPEQYFWEPWADSLYRDLTVAPPLLADDRYFEELPEAVRRGYNRVRWTWRYDTPQKYQHSVKGYYRMISEIDREVGAIRQVLRERGLDRNTIIVFMGDNGYFLGERQLAGKWLMYDRSLRVPMLIYDPRGRDPREVEDMVLNIDVPATILDAAGVAVPEAYQSGGNTCVTASSRVGRSSTIWRPIRRRRSISPPIRPTAGRWRSCAGSAAGRSSVTSRCAATDSGRRCSSRKIHAGERCAAAAVRFFGEIGSECFSGIFLPE